MCEGERLNFYRLSLLIMDGGTPTLKWLFEKQYAASGDLEIFLKSRTTVLDGLYKRKIINRMQMDLLRPSTGIKPSVEKFDTSLLITLLTNICPIQPPSCGWKVSPAASDLCPGADILRVRDARNNLFHHAKCGISDAEFQLESSNVSDAISRLSNQLDQQQQANIQKIINDARNAASDFGREKEICNLIFLDRIDEIYHLVQGIYDRGNDGAIAGLAVSEARISLPKDEKNGGTKDQPDIDKRFTLGENSIIIVVKLYADLKKELTREIVMSIAKVIFKEENSTDVLEEIERASSRRLCIDSLLKRVIHREAATVQSFLMEIKSKCPAMANLLAKTIITEEDRKKFQLIYDRVQTDGRISSRVHTRCRIDEADVKFFQDRLCYSPENVDKIADVLLSKFYMSFSDHSRVTLHSDVFTRIHVLFETIWSCHLDSVSELESVLGSELYKNWIEFRNGTSGPNGENTGIWQSIIQRICGAAASLMESICQTFHIDFIRTERGSLVLIFKAGDNFSIELLKPESVKKKVRELLEKTCPEHHPLFKDPIHVTIFIKSANYGEKEEIHFVLETIKDRKENEDGHSHFGRHERDYMIEEMDPTPLKQWMFERLNIDECTKIHLEDIISWNDIGRGEKMKILLDTLERFEDGYELLQRYSEENDKFVYDRVFQKARQQSRTDHKTEFGYDKGEGMQKLFSTWIDFSEDPTGTGIPVEILNMDNRSIQLFENALKDGKEKVYSIRVMVVGHQGVGKTTLIKRLLGKDVNISERQSTEGIDVHLHCCDVSLSSHEWTLRKKESEQDYRLQRLTKVLIEKQQVRSKAADKKQVVIHQEMEITDISAQDHVAEEPDLVSPHPDVLKTSQQIGSSGVLRNRPKSNANTMVISEPGENVSSESRMKDPNREILQLLQMNADKIKHDLGTYAPLTMWDFAGNYAFYTTHQMFLSRRAIYLLVSDLSGHIYDIVDDEIYLDEKGKIECRVLELVDVWMNMVHSCAPPDNEIMNSKVIPPAVILVGTHADAIQQSGKEEQMTLVPDAASKPAHSKKQPELVKLFKRIFTKKGAEANKVKSQMEAGANKELDEHQTKEYRHEICENYFREIRYHLKDKASRSHLVEEDFAIDNTVVDSKLEGLKRKIVEVASQQPYWGEEIPASWLPLEQVLMNLRSQGHKVIHRSLLENINQAGGVQISTDELDLFLRFQHEIGAILYFSTELLKEKIVLEPQWMINALKSLITAEMFVLRHALSVTTLWYEFKNGKLYPELIDALWRKDADLHDNKDHILLLMEQLNIIAKPTLYIDDESEIKEVNYFFAPCMLHAVPPREVIFPEHHEQMESSSVMCYVFTGKFLPAPIFHRLLAACVAQWPLATKKMKTTLENQIFCGCGVFQIDDYHKLTLHFSGYIIFMRVTRQGIKDKTPSSKLCIEVKEFIAKVLNKLIGYLGHSLKFEEFIQCPEYNDESVDINSLFPVAKLKENAEVRCDLHDNIIESNKILKFWFDGEEQSGDSDTSSAGPMPSAPFSDKDRFMCIAYLLNDVGSMVLRQLFHDMATPTCTLDQYLANNRSKIDSLLKKKVLNVSQMDIMFPPNRDPTNLTDYDITLLSALFNNIMPSLGHQEKNLIKHLRDNRNKLYGHTKSCKMNASDFQTCWSDISSTLKTLSQQCVDTNFKNEISMEIQQTQVPDASYLSMIHNLYSRIERIEQRLESNNTSTSET